MQKYAVVVRAQVFDFGPLVGRVKALLDGLQGLALSIDEEPPASRHVINEDPNESLSGLIQRDDTVGAVFSFGNEHRSRRELADLILNDLGAIQDVDEDVQSARCIVAETSGAMAVRDRATLIMLAENEGYCGY